jgi:hypothetical protein
MLTKFNSEKSGSGFRISQMVTPDRIWINPEKYVIRKNPDGPKNSGFPDLDPEKSGLDPVRCRTLLYTASGPSVACCSRQTSLNPFLPALYNL